ncbi:uncharacterized protein DFL_001893 [Arthrobotrys flagrans]|uniref:F-box domain-containing protein n=1 Tax=Arthrobotrys flagrans TaxID=97331 RepID=A0A437A958_ARTFL|nr:hypothetical protein DFL_001893 [Arthrobotrys flagrans]
MHRLFTVIEILEEILITHASRDNESRKHVVAVCRRVNKSWNDLISKSPAIRSLTWQYTLYALGGQVNVHTPFTSLERYIGDKWCLLYSHLEHALRIGHVPEPFSSVARRAVDIYFNPNTRPRDNPKIFHAISNIECLQVKVYGYNEGGSTRLAKGKLEGKENITIANFDRIIHDALLADGYDLRGSSPKICIQLSWTPPLPGIPNSQNPDSLPKPYSVRVIVVQAPRGRPLVP